jgi:hypothetical protein
MTNASSETVDRELEAIRTCASAIEGLDHEARRRLLMWLVAKYSDGDPLVAGQEAEGRRQQVGYVSPSESGGQRQPELTVKRFVQAKAPQTDVERITVLAYYLAHYRDKPHFKTSDLSQLNTEAAQPKFSNAADSASNAVKASGYLVDAGRGMRQLTAKGEEVVEALPDREAVKAVQASYGNPRRRRTMSSVGRKTDS